MSVRHALLAFFERGSQVRLANCARNSKEGTGEVWPLNVGQVYTTLQRLERDELIESDDRGEEAGPQKVFHITEAGRKELDTWLSTPSDMTEPPRDELVIKVLAALHVLAYPSRRDPGPSPVSRRADAAVDAAQGGRSDFDLTSPSRRRRALPARLRFVRWLDAADGRLKRAALEAPSAKARPAHPAEVGRPAMSYLQLRQVSKSYGAGATEVHALSNINLAVERGSLVAVMGPSGSGKSTLLTIVAVWKSRPAGEVVIDGVRAVIDVAQRQRRGFAVGTVGYVFQDFNLLAGLTAGSTSRCRSSWTVSRPRGASRRHRGPRGARSRGSRQPHLPDELSGGERQRVAIRGRRRRADVAVRGRALGRARLDER